MPELIGIVTNVEVQHPDKLPYLLDSRAVVHADRLVSRQGSDYAHIKKVYSTWIVSNPAQNKENTISRLITAEQPL